MKKRPPYASIDEYISSFPNDVQKKLRKLVKQLAPDAFIFPWWKSVVFCRTYKA